MALEDLTGSKTIDALDPNNPEGSDGKNEGDDHIRGFKNVILNTFPNITGAITLTHTQINEAAFASGTKAVFFQAAAPTNWTQDTTHNDKMMRVVNTAGGGSGGSHSPILMNVVPSHTHTFSANTNSTGNHQHSYQLWFNQLGASGGQSAPVSLNGSAFTGVDGIHFHTVSGTTASNGSASNWTPKYVDCIIATKN